MANPPATTPSTAKGSEEIDASRQALLDILEWFSDREAQAIVDNLNEPATEEAVSAAEAQLGFPLPPGLKAVYREHDGQRDIEMGNQLLRHGVGALLSLRSALRMTPTWLRWILSAPAGPDEVSQAEREALLKSEVAPIPERKLTPAWFPTSRRAKRPTQLRTEECSTAWLMFAWQENFSGWVNLRSGRVFIWAKDEGLALEADSFGEFLKGFADDLWNGKLAIVRDDNYDDEPVEDRPWVWRS